MLPTTLHELELDLDVFLGPFDLLLSLVLREELDLLELNLADIVIAYLDHLDAKDELDLEAATEFLVLIAALLELKSRLLLPGEEMDELIELAPAQAAEELLERMIQYARFRGAGEWTSQRFIEGLCTLYRAVALPSKFRRSDLASSATAVYQAERLGSAIGDLLRLPAEIDTDHIAAPRVTLAERLVRLRSLLRKGSFIFDDALESSDRMTIAITLYALLELYKRGEAHWDQQETFGEITVTPLDQQATVAA